MMDFLEYVAKRRPIESKDYKALYDWSVQKPEEFWAELWDYAEVIHSKPYETVIQPGESFSKARFFTGARLNFAENLLRIRNENLALSFRGEDGTEKSYTYEELYERVKNLALYLKSIGIGPSDRVAAYMPNMPETIIGLLATTAIGAIWSSCSPDFGSKAVLDRFGQIEPSVFLTSDRYYFKGQRIDLRDRIKEILSQLPSVKRVILASYGHKPADKSGYPANTIGMDEIQKQNQKSKFEFAQLPFDHPVVIMYSSGTTGLPKCIVQGPGIFLNHWKELALHTDLREKEKIFYYTTCGWMMWNWLVSSLSIGANVFLYDGNPFYPDEKALLRFVEEKEINVFGTSAKFIQSLEKAGIVPKDEFPFKSLRTILSTGSPLYESSFHYVYEKVAPNVQLSSISGGTDLNGCFALGNPMLGVYPGELQSRGLGMDVDVWDENGKPVLETKGELVCKKPFPSMPLYFWKDPDGEKFQKAYFERFPSVWCHGDFAMLTKNGGMQIFGRSDATLNPGGVRIGTADVYSLVEGFSEIEDSVIVGQKWGDDERVILFVKMAPGHELDGSLVSRLKTAIRENVSPRHVPSKILGVPDIPYTVSMKKVELAVKNAIHGEPILNRSALRNPESLDYFMEIPELQKP